MSISVRTHEETAVGILQDTLAIGNFTNARAFTDIAALNRVIYDLEPDYTLKHP